MRAGRRVSISRFIDLARIGEAPPLEIAISIGLRSTIAGTIKVQSAGWSTTFTGIDSACAATLTAEFTARESVAAITSVAEAKQQD
jgi:hypothetical protein